MVWVSFINWLSIGEMTQVIRSERKLMTLCLNHRFLIMKFVCWNVNVGLICFVWVGALTDVRVCRGTTMPSRPQWFGFP